MFMFWYGPSDAVNLRRKVSIDNKFNYKHFNQVCQSWKVVISLQCALVLEPTWAQQEDPRATEAESGMDGHWGPLWRYVPSLLVQHQSWFFQHRPPVETVWFLNRRLWLSCCSLPLPVLYPSGIMRARHPDRGTWRLSVPSSVHYLDPALVLDKLPSLFIFNTYFLSTL